MRWTLADEDRFRRYAADPHGYFGTMVPVDQGWSIEALVRATLLNIDRYDVRPEAGRAWVNGRLVVGDRRQTPREAFEKWLAKQPGEVLRLAKLRPPNALWRVQGGLHSATTGALPLAVIVSYRLHRTVPQIGLQVLGVTEGLGSTKEPIWTDASGVEDITEKARSGLDEIFALP